MYLHTLCTYVMYYAGCLSYTSVSSEDIDILEQAHLYKPVIYFAYEMNLLTNQIWELNLTVV